MPKISIIIPCYNQGIYLDDCISSVLSNTYKDFEIIIIEDCSTDNTKLYIEKQLRRDNRIRVINNKKNMKLPATRNIGIKEAVGEYILPLDADDKIKPKLLEVYLKNLEDNKVDIVAGLTEFFGSENRIFGSTDTVTLKKLMHGNMLQCTALFRKKDWEEVGGYNEKLILGYEDWEFWLNMAKHRKTFYRIPGPPLFLYRKKPNSMVNNASRKHKEIVNMIKSFHPDLFGPINLEKENHPTKINRFKKRNMTRFKFNRTTPKLLKKIK